MNTRLFGLALVFVLALGAGCSTTVDTNMDTATDTGSTEDTQGIAVGEPNPSAPAETDTSKDTQGDDTDISVEVDADADVDVSAVKTFTVEGSSFKFSPSNMTVKKGDTVRVTFKNTSGFHDWVLDEFNVRTKQIAAGAEETVEFVADKAGSFEYYCSVGSHRQMGMVGTLIVEE